jgi:hypothetical protein
MIKLLPTSVFNFLKVSTRKAADYFDQFDVKEKQERKYPGVANATGKIYTAKDINFDKLVFPNSQSKKGQKLQSSLCTKAHLLSPAFRYWLNQIKENFAIHRKLWEFGYILQGLYERGMLSENKKGLGFAVGVEALPSLMVSMGCEITATDLDAADSRSVAWNDTNQHTNNILALNEKKICDNELFLKKTVFRPVDMNHIPSDLRDFDFTWSSCSFEHCGSIDLGLDFVVKQMDCLKSGGIAIHTTEFNLSSNEDTIEKGDTVIFRRRDIEKLIAKLQALGHTVEPLNLSTGNHAEDDKVDTFPYSHNPHLKLIFNTIYTTTSVGLIIRKK